MLLHWLLLVFLMYMTHHVSRIQQIFISYNFVWCGVGGWADFQFQLGHPPPFSPTHIHETGKRRPLKSVETFLPLLFVSRVPC